MAHFSKSSKGFVNFAQMNTREKIDAQQRKSTGSYANVLAENKKIEYLE